jgi:hypothetical protein
MKKECICVVYLDDAIFSGPDAGLLEHGIRSLGVASDESRAQETRARCIPDYLLEREVPYVSSSLSERERALASSRIELYIFYISSCTCLIKKSNVHQ